MATLQATLLRKFMVSTFLLILQIDERMRISNALLLKCPLYQMQLQKIVGVRPPLEYLTTQNLIYAPTPAHNFKDRNRLARMDYPGFGKGARITNTHRANDPFNNHSNNTPIDDPFQAESEFYSPPMVSMICWRKCQQDIDCIAYVHLLDTDECFGFSYFERAQRYLPIGNELPLVADAEAIFYEKTCLKVPEMCKKRLWTLTKIPGSSLVYQGKKTIPMLVTRRECAERCLFENEFQCLSASFAPSYRNNRERLGQQTSSDQHIIYGRCILSDRDKMTQPDAFRAAPYDEEYIENECHERAIENDSCSYELYANSSFVYAEARHVGLTQKECQSFCSHEANFYCQGVSFYYDKGDMMKSECLLHSEDIISMGPRSLKIRENSVYMRRVKCLDVQVICTHDEMVVKYTPKDWFRGKMYVSLHSKDCEVVHGTGPRSTLLRLSIGSEAKENRCGIVRAYEVTKQFQRIFISALVVIQNNINVQTQGDRLIKVGCIMSNSTSMPSTSADGDEAGEDIPSAIALESSLQFTQHSLPNEGSLLFNTSNIGADNSIGPLPKVSLLILDLSHQLQTNDVHIGQNLELRIIAEYTREQIEQQKLLLGEEFPPLPDFRATSLVAKTQDNKNVVLLIDERGCPTDVSVFPALERLRTRTQNILRARFHAFKFSGTSLVNFDVKTHFCTAERCTVDNCWKFGGSSGYGNKWRTRRRRQLASQKDEQSYDQRSLQKLKIQSPVYISTVMDVMNPVNQTAFQSNLSPANISTGLQVTDMELPLNYNLRVRGPNMTNTNSVIYGERGILLIAGIDDQLHMDNVCLNESLLIAIFIFWLIIQIIIILSCCYIMQKYHHLIALEKQRRKMQESLEYLDGRRVHWADQSDYTF